MSRIVNHRHALLCTVQSIVNVCSMYGPGIILTAEVIVPITEVSKMEGGETRQINVQAVVNYLYDMRDRIINCNESKTVLAYCVLKANTEDGIQ